MKSSLGKGILLVILFILLSEPSFIASILLIESDIAISSEPCSLFFAIHLISVVSIVSIDYIKKGLVAYIYLVFLILKMGFAISIFLTIEWNNNVLYYFAFYWYYLVLETFIVVMLLKSNEKIGSKVNSKTPI